MEFGRLSSVVLRLNPIQFQGYFKALLLFLAVLGQAYAQSEDAFPFNTPKQESIEINRISFQELAGSQGDEGVIASLCQCPYTVLKSEDPDFPWAA